MDFSDIKSLNLSPLWRKFFEEETRREYFPLLLSAVSAEYEQKTVFPPRANVFRAFELTPCENIKVVISGQDPYHGEGQADGLAFSVQQGIPAPPSLKNIIREVKNEFGSTVLDSADLTAWAEQGVFLINSILTVEKDKALSHSSLGWQFFTDSCLKFISSHTDNAVFMLWGSYSRSKKSLIDSSRHLIIENVHPSPLSAYGGFFNSGMFTAANDYLSSHGRTPVRF